MRSPGSWWGRRKKSSALSKDAERFSDTSWQIHRQWRAGGEAPTWPVLQQTTGQPGQATGQTSEKITAAQNSWPPAPHEWRAEQPQTSTPRTTPPRDPSSPNQVGILTSPRQNNTEEHDGPNGRSRSVELSYAADRLLALWLPAPPADPPRHCLAPGPERDVARMLSTKHGQHYMVFDVSEQPGRAVMEHPGLVCELGWARGMAPPLEKLCALCKHLDSWLAAHPTNVAVLRSCGNKERLSVAVSAYLKYSSICGKSEHALDRCSMARFLESSPSLPPSNKRYVEYFAGLLAGGIRVNAAPLWLTHVTVVGAPPLSHVFLKLYEGMVPIYTSNVYSLGAGARQFTASLGSGPGGVAVRGDVLLRCYSRPPPPPPAAAAQPPSPQQRRLIFSCQFHTCAITDYTLTFTKYELDFACNDASFPVDGTVEIQVSGGRPAPAPTPAVRVRAADDAISRWDSLQHLPNTSATSNHSSNHSSNHTSNSSHSFNNHHSSNNQHSDEDDENQGVLGGSSAAGEGPIYATVSRRAGAVGAGSGGPPPPSSQGAPPGTSSPLSASLDSGISSAGRRQGSPSPGARRKELDDLLRDMLRTVEALPAPAPASNAPQSRADRSSNNTPKPDNNIPYHARPDSRPFTYGDATMLRCQAGLSSPSLVRRALRPTPAHHEEDYLGTNGYTNNNHLTDTDDDAAIDSLFTAEANESFRRKERREALSRLSGGRSPHSPVLARRPDMQLGSRGPAPPQSPGAPRKEHRLLRREEVLTTTTSPANHNHVPLSDNSHSIEFPVNREYGRSQSAGGYPAITQGNGSALGAGAPSPLGGPGESGLTWLQRQQQRLRARRDQRLRTARLPLDRSTVGRTSASHRLDGYTSDTTAFADDDDDFSIPLHVQTSSRTFSTGTEPLLPNRTSSRKFMSMDRRGGRERSMSPTGADFLDSPRDHIAPSHNGTMTREESLSSWRSVSVSEWENGEGEESRGATPAFPTTPRTPYGAPPTPPARLPPRSPITQRKDFSTLLGRSPSSPLSATTPEPLHDVSPDLVKFVRDTSKFWYKPNISRDDAITLLQNQDVGSFIIRDSNSFPNAFGLAVKVSPHAAGQQSPDLVRHFLIERTSRGVRLKGCADEPVFGSLSALVYQHSVTPLALPARLRLPASDPAPPGPASAARALLAQGAACSVLYLGGMCCEALTGPEAISRTAARLLTGPRPCSAPAAVHFKVSAAGITLTDSARRLFFRRHYPATAVSHCGLDPGDRRWSHTTDASGIPSANRIFGFVSRRPGSSGDNECHMFAELEPEQPASAIVNFVSKVMLGQVQTTNIV